ncbi:MAG: hydrogenase 4 subunit B [Candidatus Wildermuthbacteria bacterium]|nr:hydrogenase 4 subunit B [Candidatus Wildermuthbacteria bacterium]
MIESAILQYGFYLAISLFALGALGALIFGRFGEGKIANWVTHGLAAAGASIGLIFGVVVLLSRETLSITLPVSLSFLSSFINLRVDALSAFFIITISLISLVASLYGLGYQRQFYGKYNLGIFGFFYGLFLASLLCVVTFNNGFYFMIAWEVMALASYCLVIFEHRQEKNVRAGFLYFVMSQAGTAFILIAFLLLYRWTGSFSFDVWRQEFASLSVLSQNIVLSVALVGFGMKAGIIPLHVWLPEAHPAAPSHVSALMSGVMIKTAIFMLIRFFFDFSGNVSVSWGLIILVLGSISALLGVLYALAEHDLKRLLAYHSVENIGIILLGLGSAIVFAGMGFMSLAFLGMAAALYHTLNHAVFKALLFLGAGSVISQTHTHSIEEYGGLLRRMPYTGFFFLVGAVAISALPPLNGFASEWMTFQALFAGLGEGELMIKSAFIFAIVSLALAGGLAAACFVKAFGATFLAKPRSEASGKAKESSAPLLIAMGILAAVSLVLGLGAGMVVPLLTQVAQSIKLGSVSMHAPAVLASDVQVGEGFAALSMPAVAVGIVALAGAVFLAIKLFTSKRKEEVRQTWDCGAVRTPRMEITATSFSRSLIAIFRGILKPTKQTDIHYQDAASRYFTKSKKVIIELPNVYGKYMYDPIGDVLVRISEWTKKVQGGNVNIYLLYIFVTLIGLLIFATF